MKLKGLFGFFSVALLLVLSVLTYLGARSTPWLFYTIEGTIVIALFFLILFYHKIVKPLHSIGTGMELLKEQDFSSRLSPVGEAEADRVVNIFNRMMEELKNERLRLREQNHFLDLLIHASPMGVIICTFDEEISQLNPMALQIMGVEQKSALGRKLIDLDSVLAKELAAIPKNGTITVRLNDANIYKCTRSSFIDRGFPHPFFLLERLTDEVIKAEKKAYEKVIRMIAHEVNNTTAGITSVLDTVEQVLSEENNMEEMCELMQVCSERCFSMSRFITRFADVVKIPEPHFSWVNLNELAESCKRFMEDFCRNRDILIKLECVDFPLLKLDAILFEQVILNIIKNSAESIGEQGEIIIRTLPPYTLEISDTGKGISKEIETKLFTPFFSTKPDGQGIGLLCIREILNSHGCTFSLRTYEDGLTRFRITFPPE
ncbi:ATP-binding protein [uncultured Bacteroides sp.]|uniref:sensor histidine kinase n=1 Tax=uncultured Bacteroides sp. TaxID=162156 RepID=UPI002AAC44D2|nr:ATP-binding protein [uncultured Bacteroides sp.]